MAVRLVIAVTDGEWFNHLRTNSELSEVNFWSPGAAPFKALQPGELFLFKLHAPLNFIVGGGVCAQTAGGHCGQSHVRGTGRRGVFKHACALGCEGIVSKRLGSPYRSGRSRHWVKSKNPQHPAVRREAEQAWRDR